MVIIRPEGRSLYRFWAASVPGARAFSAHQTLLFPFHRTPNGQTQAHVGPVGAMPADSTVEDVAAEAVDLAETAPSSNPPGDPNAMFGLGRFDHHAQVPRPLL